MILVLENMDIQDIVLFNYDDTINYDNRLQLKRMQATVTRFVQ